MEALADLMSGAGPFPGSYRAIFSLCPYMVQVVRELSWVSFIKTLIPSRGLHCHGLITSQRPHPPNAITLGFRISPYEFGAEIDI